MEHKPGVNDVTNYCPRQKRCTRRIRLADSRNLANEKCAMAATEQRATNAPIPIRSRYQILRLIEGGPCGV
jgi:hypothetical protein